MIKAKLKNGVCRMKSNGKPVDMLDECAHLMIHVAKRLKKDDVLMNNFLNSMARYAARIYKQRHTEDASNQFDECRNAAENANPFEQCRNIYMEDKT